MREQLARVLGRDVSRETFDLLEEYTALLLRESDRQNLIASSTKADVWSRHILDSAQLCTLAPQVGRWVDIGAGAGLPGIVIAILSGQPITLVEPRRLRADFLLRCVDELGLSNARVLCSKIERVERQFDIITARAVASLDRLFEMALHLSHPSTRWVLPKGRSAAKELAEAQRSWQGGFHTVPSMTDPEGLIVLAEQVRPKRGQRGGTSA